MVEDINMLEKVLQVPDTLYIGNTYVLNHEY